ncbi:hypothetical protein H4R33_002981 [Dimargaris cristalligena]|nr:hypothetical protein H4R33_002981 [Dimargaris cristalligena]
MDVVDSLPYIDNDYDNEDTKRKVDSLIAQEMNGVPFVQGDYLAHVPPVPELFNGSPILHTEWQRVTSGRKLPPLDTSRYDVPEPSDPTQVTEWLKALRNAEAQAQHQTIRQTNLDTLQKTGPNTWRTFNNELQQTQSACEATKADLDRVNLDINRERQTLQLKAQRTLDTLEQQWMETTTQNIQLQLACEHLEKELAEMEEYERLNFPGTVPQTTTVTTE